MRARHVFVRHAPLPHMHGVCYGRTDADVADDAHECAAAALHAVLPSWPIVASPSARCLRLARALRRHRPCVELRVDARLREMDFGEWEGRPWPEIPHTALEEWSADLAGFAPPSGESFNALTQRANAAIDAIHSPHILIAHAGVMRALLRAGGMPIPLATAANIAYLQPVFLL